MFDNLYFPSHNDMTIANIYRIIIDIDYYKQLFPYILLMENTKKMELVRVKCDLVPVLDYIVTFDHISIKLHLISRYYSFDHLIITRTCAFVICSDNLIGNLVFTKDHRLLEVFKTDSGEIYGQEEIVNICKRIEDLISLIREIIFRLFGILDFPVYPLFVFKDIENTCIDIFPCDLEYKEYFISIYDLLHFVIKKYYLNYLTRAILTKDMLGSISADLMEKTRKEEDERRKSDAIEEMLTCYLQKPCIERKKGGILALREEHIRFMKDYLYAILMGIRRKYRSEFGKKVNIILQKKMMKAIVASKPINKKQFLSIPRLTEKAYEIFGEEICWEMNFYREALKHGFEFPRCEKCGSVMIPMHDVFRAYWGCSNPDCHCGRKHFTDEEYEMFVDAYNYHVEDDE